jgi:hypothetical protein
MVYCEQQLSIVELRFSQFSESITYIHTYPPDSVRNIGRPQRASIVHGCWLELVVRQKTFSHILSRQRASRWLWGIPLISFPVGSILKRCGKFHFHFFVECVQSNHISSFLSLHLYLTVQFFPTALGWKYSNMENLWKVPDLFCRGTWAHFCCNR